MSSCIDVCCQIKLHSVTRLSQSLNKKRKLQTLKQQQRQSHLSVHHRLRKTDLKRATGGGRSAVTSGSASPLGRRIDLHLAPGGF